MSTPSGAIPGRQDGKRELRGYDVGRKVKRRRWHIFVHAISLILRVVMRAADAQDHDRGQHVLERVGGRFHRPQRVRADSMTHGDLRKLGRATRWALR